MEASLPDAEPTAPSPVLPVPQNPPAKQRLLRALGWWLHGAVRVVLALLLIVYGSSKLGLGQFGILDMGDALIGLGEMSPMGLLWRMVALSPLFQVLAGVAEVGAGAALLWRRSTALGAAIGLADMVFVLVLNLGYDVPVKQLSSAMVVMSLIVLAPWMMRLLRAFLGQGGIPPGPVPTLIPWPKIARLTNVLGPVAAVALVGLSVWGAMTIYPSTQEDTSAPAGVWTVQSDTATPAPQVSEDERWQRIAFGARQYGDKAQAQVRLVNGELLTGTYTRPSEDSVELSLRPLREPGQSTADYNESPVRTIVLTVEQSADGSIHLSGDGVDLVAEPDPSGRLLFDRGFSWSPREDDPFNR